MIEKSPRRRQIKVPSDINNQEKKLTEDDMIRYYIVNKKEPQLTVKGSADSVSLFLLGKKVADYIVIKSGRTEKIVDFVDLDYNKMVRTLELT